MDDTFKINGKSSAALKQV